LPDKAQESNVDLTPFFDTLDKHGGDLDSGAIVIASKTKFRVRKPWFSAL